LEEFSWALFSRVIPEIFLHFDTNLFWSYFSRDGIIGLEIWSPRPKIGVKI
jgi:hypothetical protein